MLKVPKFVHDEALVPLGREVSRLRDEMTETVSRHAEVTKDSFAVCEKTRQVAEAPARKQCSARRCLLLCGKLVFRRRCFLYRTSDPTLL